MFFLHLKSNLGNLKLSHNPIGWDSIKYAFKRSKDYSGVTKEFIVDDLGFIKEGYDYIKDVYAKRGIEEEVTVEVYYENPNTFRQELFFSGKVDFKTYDKSDTKIYVKVSQSGFTTKFLNQDEIPINIQSNKSLKGSYVNPVSLKEIPLHSKVLKKTWAAGFDSPYFVSQMLNTSVDPNRHQQEVNIPLSFQNVAIEELQTVYNYPLAFVKDPEVIFEMIEIKESGTYVIDMDYYVRFLFSAGGRDTYYLRFEYQFNDQPIVRTSEEKLIITKPGVSEGQAIYDTVTPTGSTFNQMSNVVRLNFFAGETFNLKVGDKIRMFLTIRTPEDLGQKNMMVVLREHPDTKKKSKFKIIGDTVAPETTCKGQLPYETFKHVCESITDSSDIFDSTFLGRTDLGYDEDGKGSLYLCTDGKQIRKLPVSEYPLTFTFKDLFNSFDAKHNIGVGIEKREGKEVIVIEKKEYFYNNSLILDLGTVSDIKETIALDYYHNQIKIGYEKFENEVVNGIDEINTEVQYSTPITQVKSEYKKLSPYRSDGYGIETARRLADQPTQDSKYDEDNFLINLLRDEEGFVTEKDSEFEYIENIISPETIYNGRDTPGRMVRRHGNQITPGLIHHTSEGLKFVKGKANALMSSKLVSEAYQVKENADINVSDLADPLVIPVFHEFEHPAKPSLIKLIEANPYGYFKYTDKDGISYKSYIEEVEYSNGKANFKLIRKYGAES